MCTLNYRPFCILMKQLFLLITFFLLSNMAFAQVTFFDSLKQNLIRSNKEDTNRVIALFAVADYYGFIQFDSCLYYAAETASLSRKLGFKYGDYLGNRATFHGYNSKGNYPMALKEALECLNTGEALKTTNPDVLTQAHYFMGLLNREMQNLDDAKIQFLESVKWQKQNGLPMEEVFASYSQLGILHASLKHMDSALFYAQLGYSLGVNSKSTRPYYPLAIGALGNIYFAIGNYVLAEKYFRDAIHQSILFGNAYFQCRNYNNLAILFDKLGERDSCIFYAKISVQLCQFHNFADFTVDASKLLSKNYQAENKSDSTVKYLQIMQAARDTVFSQSKGQQFRQLAFDEILHERDVDKAKEKYQYQVRTITLLTATCVLLLLAVVFFFSSKRRLRDKIKIEQALKDLKSIQAQLIESEKMASLGEVTAGIAHEIQNPLNFVNNFSQVNEELLEELKEEVAKGNLEEVNFIVNAVEGNQSKISQHGKRAEMIVRSMLQHTRTSSGQKEPVNINVMIEECLKLSYHGLRAKEKSFIASLEMDLDENIGMISIIQQDMVRVFVNLFNNAFYSMNEKSMDNITGYQASIWVSTKKITDRLEIIIKDNGIGVPKKILDKIFQPFFTTKPTGQGTGLGLSMSYDIIKVHNGQLIVNSTEGEGAEFVIRMPFNQ
jgi:two-component system NtrC family sensor kinase